MTMKKPTTAMLDGDMIAHRAAYITDEIEDVPGMMRHLIKTWTPKGVTHVFVARSASREENYRRQVWSEYKAHRDKQQVDESHQERLAYAKECLEAEGFHGKYVPTLEADDLMGIAASSGRAIAVTLDKDLLSTPGWHYRPEYSWTIRNKETGEREKRTSEAQLIYQTEEEADLEFHRQWLMGDMTDNYPGIYRMGAKTAAKLLHSTPRVNWNALCMATYEKKGYDEEYALSMARVARILRTGEWTPDTGVVLYDPWSSQ